jgi:hypothetical protein
MVRLADFAVAAVSGVERQLEVVQQLEAEYRREIAAQPESLLRWADQLGGLRDRVANVLDWEQIEWQVRGPG